MRVPGPAGRPPCVPRCAFFFLSSFLLPSPFQPCSFEPFTFFHFMCLLRSFRLCETPLVFHVLNCVAVAHVPL